MYEDAQEAYLELMAEYDRVLAAASGIGRPVLTEKGKWEVQERLFVAGSLVRRMAKAHIRNRLVELVHVLTQIAPTLRPEDPARGWIEQAHDDCGKILETFPKSQLRPLRLLPVIPPLAVALAKLPGIPSVVGDVLLAVAAVTPIVVLAIYVTVRACYRYKRDLFLPGSAVIDGMTVEEQELTEGLNAYATERNLFALLGREKRLEVEIDRTLKYVIALLVVEAMIFVPLIFWGDSHQALYLVIVVLAFAFLGVLAKFDRTRVWL